MEYRLGKKRKQYLKKQNKWNWSSEVHCWARVKKKKQRKRPDVKYFKNRNLNWNSEVLVRKKSNQYLQIKELRSIWKLNKAWIAFKWKKIIMTFKYVEMSSLFWWVWCSYESQLKFVRIWPMKKGTLIFNWELREEEKKIMKTEMHGPELLDRI